MKLNILIVTKYKWKTRDKKHQDVKAIMSQGKFSSIELKTQYKEFKKPDIVKGRITQEWFEKNISGPSKLAGYNFAIFQFSEADGKRWGIEDGVRGTNFEDDDFFGEAWVRADEDAVVKFKDGTKRDKYTKVIAHEIAHELKRQDITKLEIHDYDFKDVRNNIEGFYRDLGQSKIQSLLAKLTELKQKLNEARFTNMNDLQPLVNRKTILVLEEMNRLGMPMRITQGYRSIAEQDELYAQGRTAPGKIVTNARGGESFHNYGVAADFVFRKEGYNATDEQWKKFGAVAKSYGFEWGGDWTSFVDRPHIQMTLNYSLSDFQNKRVDYLMFN